MSKTAREIIDLKQEIIRVTDYNKQLTYLIKQRDIYNKELEKKLKTAVKALEKMVNYNSVAEQVDKYYYIVLDVREIGKKALKEIKE
jgi:hypothetical protein